MRSVTAAQFSAVALLAGRWLRMQAAAALDVCYPRHCEGCGHAAEPGGGYLCWGCLADAHYITDPLCARCGDPVEGLVSHAFECSWCRRTNPAFDRARSAVRFRGSMREAIHRYKYNRATHLSADLGVILAGCVRANFAGERFDAIACVPLHPVKARERTYNQARLLAGELGRHLGVPVAHRALARQRFTRTQTRLDAEERKRNVRGAFQAALPEWIDGRRWLLVDDVMTTGATVDECARVMKAAGAVSVSVVTLARG
jgi:ComF family protein